MSRSAFRRIVFVIGTYRKTTLEQIEFMRQQGFKVSRPRMKKPNEIDIFSFKLDKDKGYITAKFISSLKNYDALVISGGETSSYILKKARFSHIINWYCPQPLIGSGFISGGLLDGKFVILKGGLTGDRTIYMKFVNFLRSSSAELVRWRRSLELQGKLASRLREKPLSKN